MLNLRLTHAGQKTSASRLAIQGQKGQLFEDAEFIIFEEHTMKDVLRQHKKQPERRKWVLKIHRTHDQVLPTSHLASSCL